MLDLSSPLTSGAGLAPQNMTRPGFFSVFSKVFLGFLGFLGFSRFSERFRFL